MLPMSKFQSSEHIRNSGRLFERCERWLFLGKKPLEWVVSDYTNSESARAGRLLVWDQRESLTIRDSEDRFRANEGPR